MLTNKIMSQLTKVRLQIQISRMFQPGSRWKWPPEWSSSKCSRSKTWCSSQRFHRSWALTQGLKNSISTQSLLTCLCGFPASQSRTQRAKFSKDMQAWIRLLNKRSQRKSSRNQDTNTESDKHMTTWGHWLLGAKNPKHSCRGNDCIRRYYHH